MKVLVAPITVHLFIMLLCPAMQNSARKRDSIKATFVGTRLIVQTNVAAVYTFAATKRHAFEFDRPYTAHEVLRHVGDILLRHFGNALEKPLGPEETR